MNSLLPISDFEKIITNNNKFVDKTDIIFNLVKLEGIFSLNRPRKFGKSLILSIIKCYFEGKKNLFKDLKISNYENIWDEYPIIYINFLQYSIYTIEELNLSFIDIINQIEKKFGISTDKNSNINVRFNDCINNIKLNFKKNVIILIDEYDSPILCNLNKSYLEHIINKMRGFFSVFKINPNIKFGLLVGISPINNNFFSSINNIVSLSSYKGFDYLCGFTQNEIEKYFEKELLALSEKKNISLSECYSIIKEKYDGYKFSKFQELAIYNPIDILNLVINEDFNNFWFYSGKSKFLVDILKNSEIIINDLFNPLSELEIENFLEYKSNPIPFFFYNGYLTIKNYNELTNEFTFNFPNTEIDKNFIYLIKPFYFNTIGSDNSYFSIFNFIQDLKNGNLENFLNRLKSFFSDNHYKFIGDAEKYFHNSFFIFCKLLGFQCEVEHSTNKGSIDLIVKTTNFIYIFEFKYNKTEYEALYQIKNKNYSLPFVNDKRKIFLIGVNFDGETRNLNKFIIEQLKKN